MNGPDTDNSQDTRRTKALYRTAVGAAAVAAVFCAVVCAQLIVAQRRTRTYDPLESPEFIRLKAELKESPRDETIKRRIRDMDLRGREEYFAHSRRLAVGAYLLLAGGVVLVAGLRTAAACRKKLPMPQARGDDDPEARAAMAGRWSVAAAGVIVGGLGLTALLVARRPAPAVVGEAEGVWPRFRGPGGLATSAYTNIPLTFDGKSGENILWKTPIPLPGNSSPVVWKGRVFITGATPHRSEVYCFDALSGQLLWKRVVEGAAPARGQEPLHVDPATGYAAPTPLTDGRRVFAIFPTGNVACFDMFGKELWTRKLGIPENEYGHAASLAMHENLLLVQLDQGLEGEGRSVLLALDAATGKTLWQTKRPVGSSWTSPIVIRTETGPQIITCANPYVIAYDPAGRELWRADCLEGDGGPSGIYANGLVLATNVSSMLAAIRPDGTGDVTKTHIVWRARDGLPDICSPVASRKYAFLLTGGGRLTCYSLADGSKVWEKRLKMEPGSRTWKKNFQTEFICSPSLVGNRLFLINNKGVVTVLEVGPQFKQVGRGELPDRCHACPAFADGRMYIRGLENLYCIARREPAGGPPNL